MLGKSLLFVLCAISLGGCAATGTDILASSLTRPAANSSNSSVNRSVAVAQSALASKSEDETSSITKKPTRKHHEKSQSAGAMIGSTNIPDKVGAKNATTPDVGSPEWEKEKVENDRQERHLKQVIDGICHGC